MSAFYGPPKEETEAIKVIHRAVELGATFLDTSDVYGPHTNEILLGKALKGIRNKVGDHHLLLDTLPTFLEIFPQLVWDRHTKSKKEFL